ncbi:probable serine/threonine-protein kinase PBL10 [Cynara cardunculus var. scolymus]|uniref:probable serine/threonine-protein kinase PBL10 n=1 Tax=Cynara cardunculus var. scolymus TaxID=59895 RepID=UPI000D624E2B|nr:probable serine/threonine-protein kinase PBL10 [Cynara cardunculus var. scolymus]
MLEDTRELPADHKIPNLKEFKFADLKRATSNFSPDLLLGEEGFGGVFLCWVDKNTFAPSKRGVGIVVAVKRLGKGIQGHDAWKIEMRLLGRLAHPNIITPIGYCNDKRHEYLLVYEYMQNQSFDHVLFANAKPLSWGTCLMIMIGVARGLAYLHSSEAQVIFRDVKSSNIFLDQDFNAKLGDFSLAKLGPEIGKTHVSTRVVGTLGYVAPEYYQTGHLTVKSDIYGFGVVLLETLTLRQAFDPTGTSMEHNLVKWARPILASRKKLRKIMDRRFDQNYPLEAAIKYAELALRCIAYNPKYRPSSEEILQILEQIYVVNK